MFKVFVSYSTHDLKNVTELQQSLAGTGVDVFVAEHSVAASETLSEKISSAIAGCDLFVLLWSANAKSSDWVSQEIGKAHSLGKTILPLLLDEGLTLPGFISGLKYIPVFANPQAAMAQAQDLVLKQFQAKQAALRQKEQEESRNLLVLGGLVLWLFSQK
ncbi:toll/interleukin-1 receptor domain-containing protein [Ramlibacter sp.]|uniref:toll/interleukin-1 receptor domain-containing protein n=1 Tax=Ramlibacter sp. TaxID=1917967 RepID=UPI002CA06A86|nr:toll/interleukin-1 receptor domain-containing protein [Ramlibacter sp.]HWI80717.1 toll/interleukin-1 receptor domain-containing protein [Ramlibacter sp.]